MKLHISDLGSPPSSSKNSSYKTPLVQLLHFRVKENTETTSIGLKEGLGESHAAGQWQSWPFRLQIDLWLSVCVCVSVCVSVASTAPHFLNLPQPWSELSRRPLILCRGSCKHPGSAQAYFTSLWESCCLQMHRYSPTITQFKLVLLMFPSSRASLIAK